MRGIFRFFILVVLIAVVVFVLVLTFRVKPDRADVMEQLVSDVSLEKMQQDAQKQVAIHKQYITQLQGLNSQIRSIGDNLENKINVAKGFGEIGDEYIKTKFLPLALANYNMGLEIFPQDATLNYKKGLVLANMATYELSRQKPLFLEARSFYKRALELEPTYNEPHYTLALLYLVCYEKGVEIGSIGEALSEIEIYLNQEPSSNTQGYFLKARIAFAMDDKQLAAQSYQTILNMAPIGSAAYKQARQNITQLGFR